MALVEVPLSFFTAVFQTEDKGLQLMVDIAREEKLI